MSRPRLELQLWDPARSANGQGNFDLSALTSPGGVFSPLQGATGADYYVPYGSPSRNQPAASVYFDQKYEKPQGGHQLQPQVFCDPSPAVYNDFGGGDYNFVFPEPRDQGGRTGDASHTGSMGVAFSEVLYGSSITADWGVRLPAIVAKRFELRRLVALWSVQRAIVRIKATISDGSSPPAYLPAFVGPLNGVRYGFSLLYTPGPDADATVTLEARTLGINPDQSYNTVLIAPCATYIEVPRQLFPKPPAQF